MAQLVETTEYTDWMSAEGLDSPNEYPGYDTKQSEGEASVTLELWGTQSTSLLPLHPGPLWLGVVAPNRVLSMGQIELNWVLKLNWIVWYWTVFYIQTVYLC